MKDKIKLLVSDRKGRISEIPRLGATGMKAGNFFGLTVPDLIKLPKTSELFMLPDRSPIGYDPVRGACEKIQDCFAVAAFIPPGYTLTYNTSYSEVKKPKILPLFAYGACASYKGDIYVAALHVDKSPCHDARFMDMKLVREKAGKVVKLFPKNSLIKHLKNCALYYGCPNAKNFFLNRYEAPLPSSPSCNAQCAGCISYQPDDRCSAPQPRIKFIPSPEELAEIALLHIENARDPIVSFGQGCEGEPLLCAGIIEKAIKLIRKNTPKGIINMNTNASLPAAISKLFDAGLDSIRVSLNSARKKYYTNYYKPIGYSFNKVAESVDIAKKKKGFVSINYLTMPGFTDSKAEFSALRELLGIYEIDMIQWRNLNYDPLRYFKELDIKVGASDMLGIKEIIDLLKKEFPKIKMGYFNQSRLRGGITDQGIHEGSHSRRI